MTRREMKDDDGMQARVRALFDAIVERDEPAVARVLKAVPGVVRCAVAQGATRQDPTSYYFEAIGHYAYAGDTALHIAAASHASGIARMLISAGADVRARNRRGAEPLH